MAKPLKATDRFGVVGGWYVKAIGYRVSRSGRVNAATHYLSRVAEDPKGIAADLKAANLRQEWEAITATGAKVWPVSQPDAPKPITVAPIATAAALAAPAKAPTTTTAALTIGQAFKPFLLTHAGKSHAHYTTLRYRLDYIGRIETEGAKVSDLPLGALDEATLTKVAAAIASRPAKTNGKPVSRVHAAACLKWLKYFLEWSNDEGHWTAPRRFARVFKEHRPAALPTERDAALKLRALKGDDGRYWPVDELAMIFAVADDRARLCLLLCLNCGFGASELHGLRRAEIEGLETAAPYIHRFRDKTTRGGTKEGVYGKWQLWPETADLLRRFIEADKIGADDYVLRTSEGKRIIEYKYDPTDKTPKGRYDAWFVVFKALLNRAKANAKPRNLPPKMLRKTGARMIRHMKGGGSELATMYLSHGDAGEGDKVLADYSERDWDNLTPALVELRRQLQPMFSAERRNASERMEDARKRNMEKARLAALAKRKAAKEAQLVTQGQ